MGFFNKKPTKTEGCDYTSSTDEILMELYKNGDYIAFENLYNRHSGRIYQYLKLKSTPQIAQELLHDVFIKVHIHREKYNSQYPFLPWIFTISKNTLMDHYKRPESQLASSSVSDDSILDTLATPEGVASNYTYNLHDLLKTLPDKQSKAIELRYLKDWSFEKIATELKTSEVNIRKLISRGIQSLKVRNKGGKNE